MNEQHELSESLRREADGVDVSSIPALDGIRGRAGRIQRRRRLVTSAVAAAAVAVIAPVAWTLTADQRTDSLPPANPSGSVTPTAPATPTGSSTPTSSSTPTGSATPTGRGTSAMDMNLRGLPTGKNVGIGWLDMTGVAWTVHPASGDTFQVEVPDDGVVTDFAGLTDGRWVALTSEGSLLIWDENGTVQQQEKAAPDGLAVDSAHRNVAWVNDRGQGRVLVAGAAKPTTVSEGQHNLLEPIAVNSDKADCTPVQGNAPSCSVLFNTQTDGPMNLTSAGQLSAASGNGETGNTMVSASDMWLDSNGITGYLAGRDKETLCGDFMVFASEAGEPTCDRIYGIISPDGKRITIDADSPDRSDGDAGSTRLGVFDTETFAMAWNRTPSAENFEHEASIRDRQWVNDTDLVAVVWQEGAWSLVRFGARGNATEVAPPAKGEGLRQQYALETQP